jgi:hypothetical protein
VFLLRHTCDVIGQYGEKKLKFPLFFNNMANFVHNVANRMSKFFQYVLVSDVYENIPCTLVQKEVNMSILHHKEREGNEKNLPYQDPSQEYQGRCFIQFWLTSHSHRKLFGQKD